MTNYITTVTKTNEEVIERQEQGVFVVVDIVVVAFCCFLFCFSA